MSVAIHPRVDEDPSATTTSGWLVANAARVCGSSGVGISPIGGQSSATASDMLASSAKAVVQAKEIKVFWFFSSEKNVFCLFARN
jgi:hypothetical protein